MIELDGDRLLDLFGIVLVLAIVGGLALLVFGATAVQQDAIPAPESDWTLTRVNESHVRVAHAGGDPVPAEYLSLAVNGQPRRVQWSSTTLSDGEYGVVRAGENTRVALVWERTETDRAVLQRWSL